MNIRLRPWHSINLVPYASAYSVCESEEPYTIVARAYEFTWLGQILDIEVPSRRFSRVRGTPAVGPAFSRRHRDWYWIPREPRGDLHGV